jgi:hypothetical protein
MLLLGEKFLKLRLFESEWYPVYTFNDLGYSRDVEITDELHQRYQRVMREFDDLQAELGRIYDETTITTK